MKSSQTRKVNWLRVDPIKLGSNLEYRAIITRFGQLEACDTWIEDPYKRDQAKRELSESWKIENKRGTNINNNAERIRMIRRVIDNQGDE